MGASEQLFLWREDGQEWASLEDQAVSPLAKNCFHVSYLDTILQVTKSGMSGDYAYKLLVPTPVFVECYKASQYPDYAKS